MTNLSANFNELTLTNFTYGEIFANFKQFLLDINEPNIYSLRECFHSFVCGNFLTKSDIIVLLTAVCRSTECFCKFFKLVGLHDIMA